MNDNEEKLIERLRSAELLFDGATITGERTAAASPKAERGARQTRRRARQSP